MINLKTEYEIDMMARAGAALEEVTRELVLSCRAGVRTDELDRIGDAAIRARSAKPGFLGYNGFPKSICVSVNDEAVHGIPGARRVEEGDLVSLDLGLVLDGFWADMGCTVMVGRVAPEAARLVKVTQECLELAVEQAQPGARVGDISAAVQAHAEAAGFGVIRQFVGHGIGRQMHEDPQVPNFGRAGTGPQLRPGMVLAIEPMINQGSPEVYVRPDGWTVCTVDGLCSAYAEHTVAVTEHGARVLTRGAGA
ncbi:MAG TPA: type I methionyl aminopeptidase [Candidatus Nitrosotalea sp.]|nr:type I methionyl aminopeptidase [Candidatus Nitrosotalea sp.]